MAVVVGVVWAVVASGNGLGVFVWEKRDTCTKRERKKEREEKMRLKLKNNYKIIKK